MKSSDPIESADGYAEALCTSQSVEDAHSVYASWLFEEINSFVVSNDSETEKPRENTAYQSVNSQKDFHEILK